VVIYEVRGTDDHERDHRRQKHDGPTGCGNHEQEENRLLGAFDKEEVKGILTERDLLIRVLEACKDPKTTLVSDVMTQSTIFGNPNMQIVEATRLMFQNGIKKLPILEDNRLVGLVTLTDIARATSCDKKTMDLIEALSNMHKISSSQEDITI
jgi:signal-transduction protein with cAMP-binding, CBS, and nucleotidyltransferase domain